MNQISLLKEIPWDTTAFGVPTWELLEYSSESLQQAVKTKGHHSLKVDPLADKQLLHEYGFYYCDTLIEPYCTSDRLHPVHHTDAIISKEIDTKKVLTICHGAFAHGRFHRDFNLSNVAADQRYDNWLSQLLESQHVYGLYWRGELAGFIGYSGNQLVLHALSKEYRGKGLSKYWWSEVCIDLLRDGHHNVRSSISATNLPVFNLYCSLGFSFRNPQDIYHCFVL